jgi:HK97 family phage prohead protease
MTDLLMEQQQEQQVGMLEYRSASLSGVSFPNRVIELIVAPYETMTKVLHRGRLIDEVISTNAFRGIERRGNRVRVNRDHDFTRTVGRAIRFHTSRREGLIGELRISKTELGDETLALADDRVLDASGGFALLKENGRVKEDAEVWETRDRRRLNHLFLHHIALVPDPAYETATVLEVRSAQQMGAPPPAPTPNLDRLRIDMWRERQAVIDRRYSPG